MTDTTPQTAPPSGATTEEDPLAGTPYRFIARLGKGGMGEVVEAEHMTLGHRVAVKLLLPEYFARFELKDRMRLEAQAGARIRHDNLVAVFDFGETLDGQMFVVMERLYGRTLGDELQARSFLPVTEAADIARQALAGLSAAHAAGLVHRDIKPDNLFLCDMPDGTRKVKVLDFGIAKIVDAATTPQTPEPLAQPTAEGMTVGTPRYASPEQSRGERDIDVRSDVYSMGWVFSAMITGSAPFPECKTAGDLARAHNIEMPPLPSTTAQQPIPREVDIVVLRAIAKRREDRFANAEAFRAELGRFVQGNAAATTMPSTPGPVARGLEPTELMAPGSAGRVSATGPTMTAARSTSTPPSPGSPSGARPAPGGTVDVSEPAVTRPVIPWAPRAGSTETPFQIQTTKPAGRAKRSVPVWFVVIVSVGVLGAIAFVVQRALAW